MKAFLAKLNDWMSAVTFAEAGEWETARQMMPSVVGEDDAPSSLNMMFMAVAFAEEGLHDEALRMVAKAQVRGHSPDEFLDALGLKGVRLTYGVVASEAIT